jgi:RNA polymerase sigma-70 factor, ECF subfamily
MGAGLQWRMDFVRMDFERLAIQHKDAVYRQLFRMCGNHEDAEDVLVESLTKAYRALDGLESEEAFRAWLAQIARRTCGRLKQREKLRHALPLDALDAWGIELVSNEAGQDEILLADQMKACILRALESLPPIYAEVYQARDIEGLSAEETAGRLGLTVAAVKSRLHRARSMVRERIDRSLLEGLS